MQQHHFQKIAAYRLAIKRIGAEKVREHIGIDAFESLDHAETELLREAPDSGVSFSIQHARNDYECFCRRRPSTGENLFDVLAAIVDRGAYWEFE